MTENHIRPVNSSLILSHKVNPQQDITCPSPTKVGRLPTLSSMP